MNLRTNTSNGQERLLRLPDVMALVALRKSSIYELIKQGRFPASVKLSARAVCWPSSAINRWIDERINMSSQLEPSRIKVDQVRLRRRIQVSEVSRAQHEDSLTLKRPQRP